MADNTTRVLYQAIADFSALTRAARQARRELKALRDEEARLNKQSAAESERAEQATKKQTRAIREQATVIKGHATAVSKDTDTVKANTSAVTAATSAAKAHSDAVAKSTANTRAHASATSSATAAQSSHTTVLQSMSSTLKKAAQNVKSLGTSTSGTSSSIKRGTASGNRYITFLKQIAPSSKQARSGIANVNRQLDKLSKWRPNIMPPFIVLVPAIAGLLSLLNPLVAILGTLGGLFFGLASSIGRVAGAAIAILPALFGLLSVISVFKIAFKGVGDAIKAGLDPTKVEEYNKALAKLSPSAQAVVKQIVGMSDAWKKVQQSVQEAFFVEFVKEFEGLKGVLPAVQSLLTNTASAMGEVTRQFLLMVTSPAWGRDLVLLGEGNIPIIKNIGGGLITLMDAFRDLTVIAQPFFIALTEGFLKGAENIRNMAAEARSTGSLGKWLMGDADSRGVLQTLSQWWTIIKNIGKTLGNYSGAAKEFGFWMSDGLQKATERWLESSRKALQTDSPFKMWLNQIKPLLTEVKQLFGTFFSWFREQSMDFSNIRQAAEILDKIANELGPAVARLFDGLSQAEIGPKFIDTLTQLVNLITNIVSSGAVSAFFDFLNQMLSTLNKFMEIPIVGDIIGKIVTALGLLGAFTFVYNFTGLENLVRFLVGGKMLTAPVVIGKVTTALTGLSATAPKLAAAFSGISTAVAGVAGVLTLFAGATALFGHKDTITSAETLTKQMIEAKGAAIDLDKAFQFQSGNLIKNTFDGVGESMRRAFDPTPMEKFEDWMNGLLPWVTPVADRIKEQFAEIDKAMAELAAGGSGDLVAAQFKKIADSAKENKIPLDDIIAAFPEYKRELENVSNSINFDTSKLSVQDWVDWMGGKVPEAVRQAAAASGSADPKIRGLASGLGDVAAKAQQAYLDLADVANAAMRLENAEIGLEAAYDAATEAAEKNGKTAIANGTALDKDSAAGRSNIQALQGIVTEYQNMHESQVAVNDSLAQQVATTIEARAHYIKSAEAMGLTSEAAALLADKAGLIPKDVSVKVTAEGIQELLNQLPTLQTAIDNAGGTININGNPMGAEDVLETVLANIDSATGMVIVDGDPVPFQDVFGILEQRADAGLSVTITGKAEFDKAQKELEDATKAKTVEIAANAVTEGANAVLEGVAKTRIANIEAIPEVSAAEEKLNSTAVADRTATINTKADPVGFESDLSKVVNTPRQPAFVDVNANQVGFESDLSKLVNTPYGPAMVGTDANTDGANNKILDFSKGTFDPVVVDVNGNPVPFQYDIDGLVNAPYGPVNIDAQANTGAANTDLNDTAAPRTAPINGQAETGAANTDLNNTASPRTAPITGQAETGAANTDLNNTASPRTATITAEASNASAVSSILDGIANKVRTAYITVKEKLGGSSGLLMTRTATGVVRSYASGGIDEPRRAGSLGSRSPGIYPYAGKGGIIMNEEGSGPWEAIVSGNPSKKDRSRHITEKIVERLGGNVTWKMASGGILDLLTQSAKDKSKSSTSFLGGEGLVPSIAPALNVGSPGPVFARTVEELSGGKSVVIESLQVNNPIPERSSESTARAIRRAVFMAGV